MEDSIFNKHADEQAELYNQQEAARLEKGKRQYKEINRDNMRKDRGNFKDNKQKYDNSDVTAE